MRQPGADSALVLVPTVLAYLVASWCLAALTWDGAGYVFNTLQEGGPVIAHHRYANWPSLLAVVEAGRLTDNARAIGVIYGLVVSLTPIGSLALCLHFLRAPHLRALRVWCALGILWAALPGEICLMSEASLAVQAFWPILAFLAAGLPARGAAWMLALAPYLFFLHPTAALLFGLAAALCLGLAWADRARRCLGWSAVFALLAALRIAFSAATITPYERAEFGFQPNWDAFVGSIRGAPMGILFCLYLLGVACLFAITRERLRLAARPLAVAAVAGFLGIGLWWAADATLWAGAIGYRRFVLLCTLPLVAMAAVHWIALRSGRARPLPRWLPGCVAVVFAAIYSVQCLTWRADVRRFAIALETSPTPFMPLESDPWMKGRALDHWGSSMLSAILQGREPRTLYVESPVHLRPDGIALFPGGHLAFRDGWFRLSGRNVEKSTP